MFYRVLNGIPKPCLSDINCRCFDSKLTRLCTSRDFAVCHRFNPTFSARFHLHRQKKKMKTKVHKSKVAHEGENREKWREKRMHTTACQCHVCCCQHPPPKKNKTAFCRCQKHQSEKVKQKQHDNGLRTQDSVFIHHPVEPFVYSVTELDKLTE